MLFASYQFGNYSERYAVFKCLFKEQDYLIPKYFNCNFAQLAETLIFLSSILQKLILNRSDVGIWEGLKSSPEVNDMYSFIRIYRGLLF